MEPSERCYHVSLKGGNMTLNRFCIDEKTSFESPGIFHLQKYSKFPDSAKGKGKIQLYYSRHCSQFYFFPRVIANTSSEQKINA